MPTYATHRHAWAWIILLHRLALSTREDLVLFPRTRTINSLRQQLFDSRKHARDKGTFESYWTLCDLTQIETCHRTGTIKIKRDPEFQRVYNNMHWSAFDTLVRSVISFMMSPQKVMSFDNLNLEIPQAKALKDFLSISPELLTAIVEPSTVIIRKK